MILLFVCWIDGSSAPHMYAICLENLEIEPGNKVLDIGSGTGHFTAVRSCVKQKERMREKKRD